MPALRSWLGTILGRAAIVEGPDPVGAPVWKTPLQPEGETFPSGNDQDVYAFDLAGVALEVPLGVLQPDIWRSLVLGYYEGSERSAIAQTVRSEDRVLEIGAGLGFIGTLCAKEFSAKVVSVEADPSLIAVMKRTHDLNKVQIDVVQAAAAVKDGQVTFYRQPSFWASSTVPLPGSTARTVTARSLNGLLRDHEPDVLIVDIEGGEGNLFKDMRPDRLRSVIVEVHKPQIGVGAISRCFADLRKAGFGYDPDGSGGSNVVFSRC